MRYEIESRASGEKVTIEYLDWLHLLNLAIRYDWGDMADLEHYLHDAAGVPAGEAEEMANALEKASRDLQTEDFRETAPQAPSGETAFVEPELRKGPYEGALDYFAGEGGRLVSKFIALAYSGELKIDRLYP
jgi:hypothetical protein